MVINNELCEKIYAGKRLTPMEALELFGWDLIDLGKAADFRMRLAHPENTVGFILDRIINFTNICRAGCAFCAFHARAGLIDPYELSFEEIEAKIAALMEAGGTQVMLQGGLHPDYGLKQYTQLLENVKARFPGIWLHSFSPAEVIHISEKEEMPVKGVIGALKNAGLDSMPGASDLLVDRIRNTVSPKKLTVSQWKEVMTALADQGLPSSATMTYGMGETIAEKIEHLVVVREVADRTGNIQAFIPWSFSPARTRLEHIVPATGVDYLKVVAISRIFLDNIRYIQAGWLTEGVRLAQIALSFGANDMGGVLTEELVVKATGVTTTSSRDEMIALVKNAGRAPVQRDSLYKIVHKY
ncbi:MAG: CofH family radical SAM protein [Thermodesulfobacteriota bacterium]